MTVVGKTRLLDALEDLAGAVVVDLDADGCAISRVLGDVLLFVCQASADGRNLALRQAYLVSEFPETEAVLERGEPRTVLLGERETDPAELEILSELGYAALLMLPFALFGRPWGLVEVYRQDPRPFGPAEIRAGERLLSRYA